VPQSWPVEGESMPRRVFPRSFDIEAGRNSCKYYKHWDYLNNHILFELEELSGIRKGKGRPGNV
jgi:hypothetical protein